MRKETIYLFVVILVVLIGGAIFFKSGNSFLEAKKEKRQENVAKCLTLNNVKLYISSDCDFCKRQKEIFGNYFDKIKYVECGENGKWNDSCIRKKIDSVPMWIFPNKIASAKREFISCLACKQKTNDVKCQKHCYVESEDEDSLRIVGFLSLDQVDKAFECSSE